MRSVASAEKIIALMDALGREVTGSGRIYLTGGATALLHGWRDRSPHIAQHGRLEFFHYDLYSQALAKLERGHARDLADVQAMLERQLIAPAQLWELFLAVELLLIRFPGITAALFRESVARFCARAGAAT